MATERALTSDVIKQDDLFAMKEAILLLPFPSRIKN